MLISCLILMFCLTGCEDNENGIFKETDDNITHNNTEMKLYINDVEIPISWEDNDTTKELEAQARLEDVIVSMSMYGGNEQVGSLGRNYTRNDKQTTTKCGDIVLYNGDNIVVFYGSNSWPYTRLGKMNISDNEVYELLSKKDVELKIVIE